MPHPRSSTHLRSQSRSSSLSCSHSRPRSNSLSNHPSRSRSHPRSPSCSHSRRHHSTLYDATASLSCNRGFTQRCFPRSDQQSTSMGQYHQPPRSADDILGRHPAVPYLFSPEGLPYEHNPRLPDGDLLKAVHQYAGDFYHKLELGMVASRGMDETALLAVGILIEESVREALGECGEGAFIDQGGEDDRLEEATGGNEEAVVEGDELEFSECNHKHLEKPSLARNSNHGN